MTIFILVYDYNQKDGESCYRLITRTGDFVYLKTRGYLEVDSATNVVQSFVCVNTLVSDDEGRELVKQMKRKFSVIFNQNELPEESDEAAVENPVQIERAVLNLITNLHPDEDDPDDVVYSSSTPPLSNASSNASSYASGNTQQLAIIAPKISQVKSAIEKSRNVVVIASKGITSTESESASQEGPSTSKQHQPSGAIQRPTVLQKVQNQSPAPESRVPPLPTSEHYFTQPFSPFSSSSSSSNSSMLSPASQHPIQRNSRSPFGGSIPPTSPPAIASTSASCSRNLENTASGYTRTTSVLKRAYSSNTSTCGVEETTNAEDYAESKRFKVNPSDLSACLRKLVNPASGSFETIVC